MNILEIVEDSRLDLAPDLPHDQIKERFSNFLELLVKWNKKINLTSEKVHGQIHVTGNTIIDAINTYSKISKKKSQISVEMDNFVLLTLHRSENVDNKKILTSIVKGLVDSNEDIIFPIHPRTRKRLVEFNLYNKLLRSKNITSNTH